MSRKKEEKTYFAPGWFWKRWIHTILHIVLVQLILFFIYSWCHFPILHIVLVQFILFFISSWCKIAIARQGIDTILLPQTAATTFAFSSVFILLLWYLVALAVAVQEGEDVRGCSLRPLHTRPHEALPPGVPQHNHLVKGTVRQIFNFGNKKNNSSKR